MKTRTKVNIKYMVFIIIFALLACVSCADNSSEYIKVCTRNRADNTEQYQVIYSDGHAKTTEPFADENIEIFSLDAAKSFSFAINNGIGEFSHAGNTITDSAGNKVNDSIMDKIVDAVYKQSDHMIFSFDIIRYEDRYFAFVKLNTNWQSPCYLYEYDIDSNILKKLYKWDNVDFISLSVK